MISSVGHRARWLWLVLLGLPLGCAPAVLPTPAVSRRALASPGLAVAVPEAPLILPDPPRDDTEERVLPSGLRLVIDRDPTSHLVAVVTVVRAGASVEPAGKSGLAHLVEHLTFRAVDDDAPGGVRGADRWHRLLHLPTTAPVYATTSWDGMLFRTVAPSPTWHELLAIEAGRLARPLAGVGEPALEMERRIVEDQAYLLDDDGIPSGWGALLGADATAEEASVDDVTGSAASRARLRLADARAFVGEHFRPENMTLLIAGGTGTDTLDSVVAMLPRQLVDAPADGARQPSAAEVPGDPEPNSATVHEMTTTPVPSLLRPELLLTWRLPSVYSADGLAMLWARELLTRRLIDAKLNHRDPRIVYTRLKSQMNQRGSLFSIEVGLADASDPAAVARLVEANVMGLASDAETRREFGRHRDNLRVIAALGGSLPVSRATSEALWTSGTGRFLSQSRYLAALTATSWESVAALALKYLTVPPHGVLRTPAPASPSPSPELASPPSATPAAVHDPITDASTWDAASLHGLVPPVGFATARQWTVENGMTVVYLRQPGQQRAAAWLGFRGGYASGPSPALVKWAHEFRPLLDADARSRAVVVARGVDADTSYETVTFRPTHMVDALRLLVLRARARMQKWPTAQDLSRQFQDDPQLQPAVQAESVFWRNLYPDHPYGRLVMRADARAMTPEAATAWLDQIVQPENAALVVVGDLDESKLAALTHGLAVGWVSQGGRAAPPPPPPRLRSGGDGPTLAIVDRPHLRMTYLRLGCALPRREARDPALQSVLAFTMEARLFNDLRHATGILQDISVRRRDPRNGGDLVLTTAVDSTRLGPVLRTLRRNWERWGGLGGQRATDGFDLAETNLGKWRTLGNYAARHDSPHDLARVLFNQWVQDLPFPLLDQQPAQIVAATPSDLTALFAVCRDNATMVILGDRGRVEEALADAWPLHPLAGVAARRTLP
jgi:zinc protease